MCLTGRNTLPGGTSPPCAVLAPVRRTGCQLALCQLACRERHPAGPWGDRTTAFGQMETEGSVKVLACKLVEM